MPEKIAKVAVWPSAHNLEKINDLESRVPGLFLEQIERRPLNITEFVPNASLMALLTIKASQVEHKAYVKINGSRYGILLVHSTLPGEAASLWLSATGASRVSKPVLAAVGAVQI